MCRFPDTARQANNITAWKTQRDGHFWSLVALRRHESITQALHTRRRAGDVVAVSELADPVGSIAREVPRALNAVAAD